VNHERPLQLQSTKCPSQLYRDIGFPSTTRKLKHIITMTFCQRQSRIHASTSLVTVLAPHCSDFDTLSLLLSLTSTITGLVEECICHATTKMRLKKDEGSIHQTSLGDHKHVRRCGRSHQKSAALLYAQLLRQAGGPGAVISAAYSKPYHRPC
jgi:hypothetical protein